MKTADLHLHTCFSDGTYSPGQLVAQASHLGFSAIALTDHDTVEGCVPTAEACQAAGIEFIPGAELTAEHHGHEIHILGYLMDTSNERFLAEIARFQAVRQSRIREMVARLNGLRVALSTDEVFLLANCRSPGRPHVARALVKAGHCSSLDEAFDRFLKKDRPAWVPKFKMSASEAIALIHEAGGVAVLAHPGLNRTDEIIPEIVDAGLDGIECFHTKHSLSVTQHYQHMAAHFNLLVTGGSDCHGASKGRPLIGGVRLAYEHVEHLREAAARRNATRSS